MKARVVYLANFLLAHPNFSKQGSNRAGCDAQVLLTNVRLSRKKLCSIFSLSRCQWRDSNPLSSYCELKVLPLCQRRAIQLKKLDGHERPSLFVLGINDEAKTFFNLVTRPLNGPCFVRIAQTVGLRQVRHLTII
jgi:hypothetical protein